MSGELLLLGVGDAAVASGTTLNPADTNAAMVLSNGNLTATRDASANAHRMGRSIGLIPQTDGNYYFEIRNLTRGISMCDSSWLLTQDPTDFGTGKACGTIGSTLFFSGGSHGIAPIGSTDAYNGTNWFGVYVRRSASGATVKVFLRGPSGWSTGGGDPLGAGGGHDISTPFAGRNIYASCWGFTSGDRDDFNFGGTAYTYAAFIGTVTNLS